MAEFVSTAPRPSGSGDRVFSVSELVGQIKIHVEQFGSVWVAGEVSNVRIPASGHTYFTLKDEHDQSQIAAVLFAGVLRGGTIKDRPANGQKMRAFGRVTVYPQSGACQVVVTRLEREGKGTLQEQFDRLKQKLLQEGVIGERPWTDAWRRPVPRLPRCIAMVTSRSGAVIRDMIHVLDRRFGTANVLMVPVKVQGAGAAEEIAAALQWLDAHPEEAARLAGAPVDVIIVARGGGSLEDLWAFNEEIVARAIRRSRTPVVSAIGHETDVTLADYAADRRAPTPSAAAELVMPVRAELCDQLVQLRRRLDLGLRKSFQLLRARLDGLAMRPVLRAPEERTRLLAQRLDEWAERLPRGLRQRVTRARDRLRELASRPCLTRPEAPLLAHRALLDRFRTDLVRNLSQACARPRQVLTHLGGRLEVLERNLARVARERLAAMASRLESLGPLQVLSRGYTLTKRAGDGRVLTSATQVVPGERLCVVFRDGEVAARAAGESADPEQA